MTTGYDLWAEVGPRGRDYFLPRPAEDLQGFRSGPASSSDMAALLCRAMQELQAPSGERMLSEQLAMVWTGHSERATLPSWLAAQGAPKEDRDTVGRWTPKDSDDYVRNYKAVVKRLLNKVVQDLIAGVAFDTMDEQGNMQELLDAVVKSGVDFEQATEEISTLTSDARVWLLFVTHPSPSLARTPAGAETDVAASIIGFYLLW